MDNMFLKLEKKYGKWNKEKKYLYNCVMPQFRNVYLNILFIDSEYRKIKETFERHNLEMSNSIKKFYKEYNGVSLFGQSFVIFGHVEKVEMGYTPLGIDRMNTMLRVKNTSWDNDFVAIGECSKLNFCLKRKDKSGTIYIINRFNNNIVKKFSSFDEMMKYFIEKLLKIYNSNGILTTRLKEPKNIYDNMCSYEDLF